ncbi:MAG: hypothetical protein RL367_217 [Pseudomonadota bacterium]|jgi:uncharacterized DUF497 family protein
MTIGRFEWDESKNVANQKKHGISFEDASEVFGDPLYVTMIDPSGGQEERWRTYGIVDGIALLMVVHTDRDDEGIEIIRLISARRATRHERNYYERENG